MYKNRTFIILFSLATSLVGVFITFGRKTMFKKYDVETVYFIDLILSTVFILLFLFMFGNTKNIVKNAKKFTLKDWGVITSTALFLSFTLLFGGKILENNDISYLTLLDTAIDVLASLSVAYLFYNEELTVKKIFGLILIMTGVFIIH
jgi:drug/metabolite transporter (DMT)-like permease